MRTARNTPAETERVYESLSTEALRAMRAAFKWDLAHGGAVGGRIDLIERILAQREAANGTAREEAKRVTR
jgi:hypothetical protein